jgi:hypothetical protein
VLPMITAMGLQDCFIMLAFLGMTFWAFAFVMIYYGKSWRTRSAAKYWALVRQHGQSTH